MSERERVPPPGPVASTQELRVPLPVPPPDAAWSRERLERLGRAYWRHVTRATLGLVRVRPRGDDRISVLLAGRLALLRLGPPVYESRSDGGRLSWRIEGGLLVARRGRGRGLFEISIGRAPAGPGPALVARMEVRGYQPWLRGGGRFTRLGAWLYGRTQLRVHVLICDSFLRALARAEARRAV